MVVGIVPCFSAFYVNRFRCMDICHDKSVDYGLISLDCCFFYGIGDFFVIIIIFYKVGEGIFPLILCCESECLPCLFTIGEKLNCDLVRTDTVLVIVIVPDLLNGKLYCVELIRDSCGSDLNHCFCISTCVQQGPSTLFAEDDLSRFDLEVIVIITVHKDDIGIFIDTDTVHYCRKNSFLFLVCQFFKSPHAIGVTLFNDNERARDINLKFVTGCIFYKTRYCRTNDSYCRIDGRNHFIICYVAFLHNVFDRFSVFIKIGGNFKGKAPIVVRGCDCCCYNVVIYPKLDRY